MVQKVELSNAFIYACTFNHCLLGFIFVFFYLIHRHVRYIMLLAPFCAHAAHQGNKVRYFYICVIAYRHAFERQIVES